MISITGMVTSGLGAASGNKQSWQSQGSIYHQVKQLQRLAPTLASQLSLCRMGTINMRADNPTCLDKWEYIFPTVPWLPDCPDWGEELSFTPVIFGLNSSSQRYSAWLYRAAKSPHRNNPYLLEIIAPNIPGIATGVSCFVKVDARYLQQLERKGN